MDTGQTVKQPWRVSEHKVVLLIQETFDLLHAEGPTGGALKCR